MHRHRITTNIEAEMRAVLKAAKYWVDNNVRTIILEFDSLLMVYVINDEASFFIL